MDKLVFVIFSILVVFGLGARYVSAYFKSAYFKSAYCKKFIELKHSLLAYISIAGGYGRSPRIDLEDRNKISVVGILSHIYFLITFIPFVRVDFFQLKQDYISYATHYFG